jgi:hypothetical protein
MFNNADDSFIKLLETFWNYEMFKTDDPFVKLFEIF